MLPKKLIVHISFVEPSWSVLHLSCTVFGKASTRQDAKARQFTPLTTTPSSFLTPFAAQCPSFSVTSKLPIIYFFMIKSFD